MAKTAEKKTVASVACAALRAGKTNEQALAEVKKAFPKAKASLNSMNWYRSQLRADGEKVPTMRELKAKAKAGKNK